MNEQNKNSNKKLRSGERQIRNNMYEVEWNHKWRYCKALNYITKDDVVLDAGIGCGFGSNILSLLAKKVIGVDDSLEAINYANKVWKQPNIEFSHVDLLQLSEKVDVVCAFEIIEHLKDDKLLFEKFKELNPKYIILSTPHDSVPTSRSAWHWRHYSQEDIDNLFKEIGYKTIENELVKFKSLAVFAVGERI